MRPIYQNHKYQLFHFRGAARVYYHLSRVTKEQQFLLNSTEPFEYKAKDGQQIFVSGDWASAGLSWICRETRKRGILIYLSGSGADEYISDYARNGEKIWAHSTPKVAYYSTQNPVNTVNLNSYTTNNLCALNKMRRYLCQNHKLTNVFVTVAAFINVTFGIRGW